MITKKSQKGATSVILTFVISIVLITVAASLAFILSSETREVGYRGHEKRSLYLAQAGIKRATVAIQSTVEATYAIAYSVPDTVAAIDALYGMVLFTQEAFGEGTYGVEIVSVEAVPGYNRRNVSFRATGHSGNVEESVVAVVTFGFSASKVFDHCYFINNYGWFWGGAQTFQGDVRANGDFSVIGAQKINGDVYAMLDIDESMGSFFYDSLERYYDTASDRARPGDPPAPGEDAYPGGYDGFEDGYDSYGDPRDPEDPQLHPGEEEVPMPYLGDLSYYQDLAISEGGTIYQGGAPVITNVHNGTISLIGTEANPIVINGPVVVTEDVVIKGVVSGQGTIYAGRNVHIIDDITYDDPPAWPKPDYDPETTSANNVGKDFLALTAKGNVIMGDYTHPFFNYCRFFIRPPFTNPYVVDESDADIGYVSYYQGDDPYYDGDYTAYDGGYKNDGSSRRYYESSLSNAEFDALNPQRRISQCDALIYTNHLISGRIINMNFNGSVIGRDEALVFNGYITMNFDYRVRESGHEYVNINLPLSIMDPETIAWREE